MALPNVEIISTEIIQPSSRTPNHLKTLKLSFLDQATPPVYVPIIFFFTHQDEIIKPPIEISRLLKQSLSSILTIFYPLAGNVQENTFVDCNDEGVEFVEARVHSPLREVIKNPRMEELKKFLPVQLLAEKGKFLLHVKANFFSCGGIALGVCLWHRIGDGASMVSFMKAWAATCRGEADKIVQPSFDLADPFPPSGLLSSVLSPIVAFAKDKITTNRLVFDKEKIEKLKEFASRGEVKNPTRVESVSAFIWKRLIDVAKSKMDTKKRPSTAMHAVNLRPRTIPPLSENDFGNCFLSVITSPDDNSNLECSDLVNKLRVEITKVDQDYIKKMQNQDENLTRLGNMIYLMQETENWAFSSWCRFPVYEVDFGWGKPVWVCTTTFPYKNLVVLMSTPSGDGIEAWINVLDDDVEMFEKLDMLGLGF